jgi:hypothetical protein
MQSEIQLASIVMAMEGGRIGSTTSGRWGKYNMVGECICIKNLFLNNFLKKANLL